MTNRNKVAIELEKLRQTVCVLLGPDGFRFQYDAEKNEVQLVDQSGKEVSLEVLTPLFEFVVLMGTPVA